MIFGNQNGSAVIAWYGKQKRDHMPHHGRIGIVVGSPKGRKPRNYAVRFDGIEGDVVIPAGNLRLNGGTGEL